jgi:hypothetical protein
METDMASIESIKQEEGLVARRVRAAAIVVVLATIVLVAEHRPADSDTLGAAPTSAVSSAAVTDYFPARFAAPTGEPEQHVQAF